MRRVWEVQTNPNKTRPGALPTAHERDLAGSAHGMTTMVEAEGMNRCAPAALTGSGDAQRVVTWWNSGVALAATFSGLTSLHRRHRESIISCASTLCPEFSR